MSDAHRKPAGALEFRSARPANVGVARTVDFRLVGGGVASAFAWERLRFEDAEGSMVIIGTEDRLPNHRPPLSGANRKADAPIEPALALKNADFRTFAIDARSD